jgi:NADH:ubiquinone oxidoreductase subunit
MADLTQTVIHFTTITRFIVRKGEVGLGWDNNNPVFFEGNAYSGVTKKKRWCLYQGFSIIQI